MSAQSRGGGGLKSWAPLERWATLAVWSPQPTRLPGSGGVQGGKESGGSLRRAQRRAGWRGAPRGKRTEQSSPPLTAHLSGGPPSSWSGPHRLGPALAAPVSLPLELFEGLTCPDSSAGWSRVMLQRMWSWKSQGPSWVLCPLRPGDRSEVPPTCLPVPASLGGLTHRRVTLVRLVRLSLIPPLSLLVARHTKPTKISSPLVPPALSLDHDNVPSGVVP